MTWDTTKPAGTRNRSLGDDDIREFKTDLQTALQAYGNFPVSTSSPEYHYQGQRGNTASRPTNGEGGLYFDTDTEEVLRDNGSSWDRVAINIPTGTKMFFYQAAAPTGWTIDSSVDDRIVSINNSNGGTTNGSFSSPTSSSSGSHTHDVGIQGNPAGNPIIYLSNSGGSNVNLQYRTSFNASTGLTRNSISGTKSGTISGDLISGSSGAHTHTLTHSLTTHNIAYVVMATKDAS